MKEYNVLNVIMSGANNDECYGVETDIIVDDNAVFEIVKEYGHAYDGYKLFCKDYNACLYNLVKKVDKYCDERNICDVSYDRYDNQVDERLKAHRFAQRSLFWLKVAFNEAFEKFAADFLTADFMAVEKAVNDRNAEDFKAYFNQLKNHMVVFYGDKEAGRVRDWTPDFDCKYLGEMLRDIHDTFERGFSRDSSIVCEFWFAIENVRDKVHDDNTKAVITEMFGKQKLTPHSERYEPVYDKDGTPVEDYRVYNNPY